MSQHRPPEESSRRGPSPPGPGWLGAEGRGAEPVVQPLLPTRAYLAVVPRCWPEIKNRFSTEPGLGFTNSMMVSSWPCLEKAQPAASMQEPGRGPAVCPSPLALRS